MLETSPARLAGMHAGGQPTAAPCSTGKEAKALPVRAPLLAFQARCIQTELCARMHSLLDMGLVAHIVGEERKRLPRPRCRSSVAARALPVAALSQQVLRDLRGNDILMIGMCGWFMAQFLKARAPVGGGGSIPGGEAVGLQVGTRCCMQSCSPLAR